MATAKKNSTGRVTPAKPKVSSTPTTASAWKAKSVEGTPLVVPSGNTCLVRAPGLQVFIKQGMIPNSLLPIVNDAIKKGSVPTNDDFNIQDDPEMLNEMMELMDAVTVYCVVEPAVEAMPVDDEGEPIPFSQRDPDTLYVDEVDFTDKIFIFQYAVGGSADLAKFRKELGQHMEVVPGS